MGNTASLFGVCRNSTPFDGLEMKASPMKLCAKIFCMFSSKAYFSWSSLGDEMSTSHDSIGAGHEGALSQTSLHEAVCPA